MTDFVSHNYSVQMRAVNYCLLHTAFYKANFFYKADLCPLPVPSQFYKQKQKGKDMTNSAVEMMPNEKQTEQFHLPDPSITLPLPLPLPTQSFLKAAISLKEKVTFFTHSLSILLKMDKLFMPIN